MKNRAVGFTLTFAVGIIAGTLLSTYRMKKEVAQNKELADKHLVLYQLMNEWVHIKQEGKGLESFFIENNYKNIAIYGLNYIGRTLVKELHGTGINVIYAVDQNADMIYADIEVKKPDEELQEVDVMVVTPITHFDQIEMVMHNKINCPIVSIDDILYEI